MALSGSQDRGLLYHLVQQPLWQKCKDSNTPYTPPTFEADGFIHLTKEAPLLLGIANHFYKGIQDSFLVLVIDSSKLAHKVVFEAAASVGSTQPLQPTSQQLFPHLYGPLNLDAVTQELAVQRDADGSFVAIEGLTKQ
eukprot:GHUV01005891.1.p1 GENE.GHUV01005891.1~~GHUV01005891.1.p1  ORF type:complete len:138 (+),score=46.29 GHUV01005891.1:231-644(+)